MQLSIYQFIFHSIPESIVLFSLALALAGNKLEYKKIFLVGLTLAISIYIIRLLPIAIGIHTIIFIIVLAILLKLYTTIKLSRSLLLALLTQIILAIIETISLVLSTNLLGLTYEQLASDKLLWIVAGWPHIIVTFLVVLAINKRKRKPLTLKEESF